MKITKLLQLFILIFPCSFIILKHNYNDIRKSEYISSINNLHTDNDKIIKNNIHFTMDDYLNKYDRIAKITNQKVKLINNNIDIKNSKLSDDKKILKKSVNNIHFMSLSSLTLNDKHLFFNNHLLSMKTISFYYIYCKSKDKNAYFLINNNKLNISFNNNHITCGTFKVLNMDSNDWMWFIVGGACAVVMAPTVFWVVTKIIRKIIGYWHIISEYWNININLFTSVVNTSTELNEGLEETAPILSRNNKNLTNNQGILENRSLGRQLRTFSIDSDNESHATPLLSDSYHGGDDHDLPRNHTNNISNNVSIRLLEPCNYGTFNTVTRNNYDFEEHK